MMWALVLIIYVGSVNDAQVGIMRKFKSEASCEAAGAIARSKLRPGFQFEYLCLPSRT